MLGVDITVIAIVAGASAVGTLTIEHGWGWVLAKYKARKARLASQGGDLLAIGKALADRVIALEKDVGALKTKVGL